MEENKGHQKDLERNVFGLSMILAKQLKENQKFTEPDYWEKLKHQYAGMAMQGLLNNNLLSSVLFKTGTTHEDYINEVVNVADEYAKALITRMKNV